MGGVEKLAGDRSIFAKHIEHGPRLFGRLQASRLGRLLARLADRLVELRQDQTSAIGTRQAEQAAVDVLVRRFVGQRLIDLFRQGKLLLGRILLGEHQLSN